MPRYLVPKDPKRKFCIKYHNLLRTHKHHTTRLGYNELLEEEAQLWADNLRDHNTLEEEPMCPYGENIYCCRAGKEALSDKEVIKFAINSWYREVDNFEPYFCTEPTITQVMTGKPKGHFTQLVWNQTVTVGIGISRGPDLKVWVVCKYSPPGNVFGYFRENVMPQVG
ncbi:hypothetical protein WDU94_005740 [Cyamophila willieti]